MINTSLLPKKVNENNYFKKENKGCTLYSFSMKKSTVVVCRLEDYDIENDFCIDDKTLNMIKALSPIKDITFGDNQIIIKGNKGRYKAKLLDSKLLMPNMSENNNVKFDIDKLKKASLHCATNQSRPYLCGVAVNNKGNIVATDSFTAFRYIKDKDSEDKFDIIIPKDFIDFICTELNGEIEIKYNSNTCMVTKDNITYVNTLINGVFPGMSSIFKIIERSELIKFDYEDFSDKLSIAKQVGNDIVSKLIILKFNNGNLKSLGECEFETELTSYYTNDYEFNVAMDKLNIILNSLNTNTKEINLYYYQPTFPLFVLNDENELLILPLRVSGGDK